MMGMAGVTDARAVMQKTDMIAEIDPRMPVYRGILSPVKESELPFEKLDEFSRSPLEFEHTASMLWKDTQIIFNHACRENRFSENYLKYCAQLEKNIKRVGSLCLTKAVLEQNGESFPKLEDMTIRELAGMTACHLRKCHAALEGLYWDNDLLGMTYLNWEFRWFDLAKRLNATEVKIQKIREGKISYIPMLEQARPFKSDPKSNGSDLAARSASLRINANALPLDSSMGKVMVRAEKVRKAEEKRQNRLIEQLNREMMKDFKPLMSSASKMDRLSALHQAASAMPAALHEAVSYDPEFNQKTSFAGSRIGQINSYAGNTSKKEITDEDNRKETVNFPENAEKTITEGEARDILIQKAVDEGDKETLDAILSEDTHTFHQRWMRYVEETERQNRVRSSVRAGPSAETRKKLRSKRKKK